MSRLSQTNPELFENPTLGEATTNPYLDQQEAQATEDYNARLDGREPRTVIAKNRYPQFMPAGSVPSDVQPELEYVGEITTPGEGEYEPEVVNPEPSEEMENPYE